MRSRNIASISKLKPLLVLDADERHLVLSAGEGRFELSALAPDLFRFRATPHRSFSATPSWAVCNSDWPPFRVCITRKSQQASIATDAGRLQINLSSSELQLLDPTRNPLLRSQPMLSGVKDGEAQVAFCLTGRESFLGMGEASGPFNRKGMIQKFWNTDALGHGGINPSLRNLYTSIPFTVMLCDGRAMGLFWDNPARQQWDLGQRNRGLWQLNANSGEVDLYLFLGPGVADVVQRYAELTGLMPMPPRWALGYHQCRYSYQTRAEVMAVARQLRQRRIPCDALYLDIHHMHGYRVFTFGRTFPQPATLIDRLRHRGFHTIAIVDPGVKVDSRFGVFQRGKRIKAYVRTADGKADYVGQVWPGSSVYPDFLHRRVRDWWGREQERLQRAGIDGFWNDMNEPANFSLPSKTLPENCRHDTDHGPMPHSEAHNLYGMQMARASREGALQHKPDQRPFVITRAAYSGAQRHAMLWTGDNASSWEQLTDSVQMLLNLGLSGFPFCGGDAGGFMDNCTPELYARWMQMAAFTPFFRNHTTEGTLPHEPWAFGPEVESIVRRSIELRYQLLPYWYCLFAEAHRTGAPIMRPLVWHHQDDPVAAACGDQFMLGPSLLVAPVLQQGAEARSVYLPRGTWFDFWSGKRKRGGRHVVVEAPLYRLPLFVRAGTILPMIALRQHTGGRAASLVNLHLWPGGCGTLDWYEDDGESSQHLLGAFHRRRMQWDGSTLSLSPSEGEFASRVKQWRVVLRNTTRALKPAGVSSHVRYDRDARIAAFEVQSTPNAFRIKIL